MKSKPKVFISYVQSDRKIVDAIKSHLKDVADLGFVTDEMKSGQNVSDRIEQAVSTSDYVLLILSKHSALSKLFRAEIDASLFESFRQKSITVLPFLVDDVRHDFSRWLNSVAYIDASNNLEDGMRILKDRIVSVPQLDFDKLSPVKFEMLVGDLLTDLGFKVAGKRGADFTCSINRVDPFGKTREEIWLVETKFYSQSRPTMRTLKRIVGTIATYRTRARALLVTNGQLTSATKKWLEDQVATSPYEVQVIEGNELRSLLLNNPNLVKKYFGERLS